MIYNCHKSIHHLAPNAGKVKPLYRVVGGITSDHRSIFTLPTKTILNIIPSHDSCEASSWVFTWTADEALLVSEDGCCNFLDKISGQIFLQFWQNGIKDVVTLPMQYLPAYTDPTLLIHLHWPFTQHWTDILAYALTTGLKSITTCPNHSCSLWPPHSEWLLWSAHVYSSGPHSHHFVTEVVYMHGKCWNKLMT